MKLTQIGLIVYGTSLVWFWYILLAGFEISQEQGVADLEGSKLLWGPITAGWFIYLGFEIHKHFKSKKPNRAEIRS